jgi:hypothetical protein
MTTNHLKTGIEPTPEIMCISNILQTVDKAQHSVSIMNNYQLLKKDCAIDVIYFSSPSHTGIDFVIFVMTCEINLFINVIMLHSNRYICDQCKSAVTCLIIKMKYMHGSG